jgi:hypothetical protein
VETRLGCGSVAFTYNDPVIFMEYAVDVHSPRMGAAFGYARRPNAAGCCGRMTPDTESSSDIRARPPRGLDA